MVYPKETRGGHGNQETKVLFWVLFLREAQLAGPDYRLGPPLDLELPENALIVPLGWCNSGLGGSGAPQNRSHVPELDHLKAENEPASGGAA